MSREVPALRTSSASGSRLGRSNGTSRVLSGWIVKPYFANRLGRTASTRRASSSQEKPMTKSSAYRIRNDRPLRRGWTSRSNQSSST